MRSVFLLFLAGLVSSCASMVTLTVYDYPVPVYSGPVVAMAPAERITIRYDHLPPTDIEVHMTSTFDALGERYVYDVQIDGQMSVRVQPQATFTGIVIRDIAGTANGKLHSRAKMNLSWVAEFDDNGAFRRYLRSDLKDYQVLAGDGFYFSEENEVGAVFPQMLNNVSAGGVLARFTRAPGFNLGDSQSTAICRLRGRVVVDAMNGLLCEIEGEIMAWGQNGSVDGYVIFEEATGAVISADYVITGPGRKIPGSLYSQKITFKRPA